MVALISIGVQHHAEQSRNGSHKERFLEISTTGVLEILVCSSMSSHCILIAAHNHFSRSLPHDLDSIVDD